MDDRQGPSVVFHNNTHMFGVRIKYQVAGLCAVPSNSIAITVLISRTAAMPDYIFAAIGIIEYPIDKTGAV